MNMATRTQVDNAQRLRSYRRKRDRLDRFRKDLEAIRTAVFALNDVTCPTGEQMWNAHEAALKLTEANRD